MKIKMTLKSFHGNHMLCTQQWGSSWEHVNPRIWEWGIIYMKFGTLSLGTKSGSMDVEFMYRSKGVISGGVAVVVGCNNGLLYYDIIAFDIEVVLA